jgi:hypothetical protein
MHQYVDVSESGGELAFLDGATFAFNDDVIIVEFGVWIEDVNGRCAIFDIVGDEAVVVDVIEGLPFDRDLVIGVGGELFRVIGCGSHFFGVN